jgi:hypothetical protein
MLATDANWAKSFARQALSDLAAREALVEAKAEKCHRLHFLQMAAEKACKTHRIVNSGHEQVRKSHAYIQRELPALARYFYALEHDRNQIASWELSEVRGLAREIELLAPACDDGHSREDNSDYPWLDATGQIMVPCEFAFPSIDDGSRSIIRLIKLIRTAAESYSR